MTRFYNSQYLNQDQEDIVNEFCEVIVKKLGELPYVRTSSLSKHGKFTTISQIVRWFQLGEQLELNKAERIKFTRLRDVIEQEIEQIDSGTQVARSEREPNQ